MQKRSHKLLASALLRSRRGFDARRYEWAFLFGSFQPDCNPFTFLRGSFRAQTFGGHSFSNSQHYIDARIRKLQSCPVWRIRHYYALGKLTHYLADAFTYPHNETYPDTLMDHHRYESALRLSLTEFLSANPLSPQVRCDDLSSTIAHLHRNYAQAESNVRNDIHYILAATGLLMANCCPDPLSIRKPYAFSPHISSNLVNIHSSHLTRRVLHFTYLKTERDLYYDQYHP